LLVLTVAASLDHGQTVRFSDRRGVHGDWAVPRDLFPSRVSPLVDTTGARVSHRRATTVGATSGAIIGGVGAAAFILNALAPDCVTAVSTGAMVWSSHCGHREGIVAVETVTIAAGVTAGAFGGAWIARRIAGRWTRRHRDPLPDGS
jgi:hypothetical protein